MKFVAEIDIMPHKELLDPQGKAVSHNLKSLDIHSVADVRIGKHITLTLEAETEEEARETVDNACRKLLANLIMESFAFELTATE
jgi:phosphoribosylformylglycinamidine synthase PurS subunit